MDTEQFIEKANLIHGNKYDYSKVNYINAKTKVIIICKEHGEFEQTPTGHLSGRGCPVCRYVKSSSATRKGLNQFIVDSKNVHGDKYDYSKVNYVNNRTKVCIICPEHGEFWQRPDKHILRKQGCPYCSGNAKRNINSFVEDARRIHGHKYDYSKSVYRGIHEKLCIICPEHGEFWQAPNDHLHGQGCPGCKGRKIWDTRGRLTVEDVKKQLYDKYGDKYDYSLFTEYSNNRIKIPVTCKNHGVFYVSVNNHLRGRECPSCSHFISRPENEIYEYICQFIPSEDVIKRDRTVLSDNKELDIYIPKLHVAIEYNGLRWHSEEFNKNKNYHLNKLTECNGKGIKLIQIFEDEWIERNEIVLKKIKHILGFDDNSVIYARKCSIMEISYELARNFLEKNHIQGFVSSTKYFGAFYNESLVGVMTFLKERKDMWNLTRFATDNNKRCIGLAGKLFKAFLTVYNPKCVKSFADRRWTLSKEENVYTKLGFTLSEELRPDYRYVNGQKREHKFSYRKDKLHKKYGVPLEWTEKQMTEHLGFYRIYDCGLLRYEWKKEKEED